MSVLVRFLHFLMFVGTLNYERKLNHNKTIGGINMQNKKKTSLVMGGLLLLSFILFTATVIMVDVQAIGPHNSKVGLATINYAVFNFLKVNLIWYHITDWLGFSALFIALGFTLLGLKQLIHKRSLWKVDFDIILLGLFYSIMIDCYMLFEKYIINYRPILLDGNLESSYPSSHIMLVIIVMGTAIVQFNKRMHSLHIKRFAIALCWMIIFITIIGRLIAGVHWFSDITGGVLLGSSLCMFYHSVSQINFKKS